MHFELGGCAILLATAMTNNSSLFGDFVPNSPQKSAPRKKRGGKLVLFGAVCSLILLSVGLGSRYIVLPQPKTSVPDTSAIPAVLPASTSAQPTEEVASKAAAPEIVDEKTGLSKTVLTITVQNGSGELGVGIKASEVLKTAGYTVVSIGNAPTFDYTDVSIMVKPANKAYLLLLKRDLGKEYKVASTSATLANDFPSDAVVIVGKEK